MATWSGTFMVEAGGSAGYSCLVSGALEEAPAGGPLASSKSGGILFESLGAGNIAFARFPTKF